MFYPGSFTAQGSRDVARGPSSCDERWSWPSSCEEVENLCEAVQANQLQANQLPVPRKLKMGMMPTALQNSQLVKKETTALEKKRKAKEEQAKKKEAK